LARLASRTVRADEVAADPVAAAHDAASALMTTAGRFIVHFDVDVIGFYDLPAANWPEYHKGLTLADAMSALAVLIAHPGCAALTVTEFNPDHGEPDGSTARTLAEALATALSGRPS
jgi:arginase